MKMIINKNKISYLMINKNNKSKNQNYKNNNKIN